MSRLAVMVSPVLLIAIVLSVPILFDRQTLRENEFDGRELERLEREAPKVLLLGNSMLFTRIDEKHLRKISGLKISMLSNPGAFSACFYLWLKNYACAMRQPPETVIVFFRDNRLTLPAYSTTGQYATYIRSLMHEREPEIEKIIGLGAPRLTWNRTALVQWFYPLTLDRYGAQRQVYNLSMDVAAGSGSKRSIKAAIDEEFQFENLRHDLKADIPDDEDLADFDFEPEHTFLPLMLQLAREHSIKLIFYRVKRRPNAGDLREQTKSLQRYISLLRPYMEAGGATMVDETGDASLGIKIYADGDHVAEPYMRPYTEKWWQRMQPVLAPAH